MIGTLMPFIVGSALAIIVGLFAAVIGFDREKGFYATLLMVIASYYVLFAALAPDGTAMAWEVAGFLLFCTCAVIGFRTNLWFVVAGLAGHGMFDAIHGLLITNAGAPPWWPDFCFAFDLVMASWLGWILIGTGRSSLGKGSSETEATRVSALWHLLPRRSDRVS